MEKLRENYKNGEKLHALDVNKITHNVNVLADGVQIVDKLPEEGETGVIYAVPNKDRIYEEYEFGQIILEDGYMVADSRYEIEGLEHVTLKVGDIIMANADDSDSDVQHILATSVNQSELKIAINPEIGLYATGITNYINYQPEHQYRITGVYDVPIDGSAAEHGWQYEFYHVVLYTYEEVVSDIIYFDYYTDKFPAFNVYITRSGMIDTYLNYYSMYSSPLVKRTNIEKEIASIIVIPIESAVTKPEVGDIIRYTGEEYQPISDSSITMQYIAVSSIDEDNLKVGMEGIINGISEYVGLQTNHCYVVTGKHTIPVSETMTYMFESEEGVKVSGNITIYTYDEIPFTSNVTYTLEFFPEISYDLCRVDGNIYDEYYWNNGKYEAIGGGGAGGDSDYVTMNYLENNYYSRHDIQNSYYDKVDVDVRLEDKANSYHTHSISEVTDLQSTLNDKVTSHKTNGVLDVTTIWKGTQAEYDAITTKDAHTLYIITEDEGH